MRILTVANHLGSLGGLERTQLVCCQGLVGRGHSVDLVYVSEGDFTDVWRAISRSMHRTETTLPRRGHTLSSIRAVASALRAARRLRPDIVYVFRTNDVPFGAAVAAVTGARLVLHLCLPPPHTIPRWLRTAFRRIDVTLSVSQDTAARWLDEGVHLGKVTVVLTSVDLERYTPATDAERAAIRSGFEIGPDEFLVLYAGRVGQEKGVDVLLRAFALLAGKSPGCRLVVAGGPSQLWTDQENREYRHELDRLLVGLPARMVGAVGDVVPLLQAADVAVVPSRWPDPLPRGAIEPLACGVPVIGSAVGGIPEILTGPMSEFLVPPDDPVSLSDALLRLRYWRTADPGLGERCRKAADERPSLDDEISLIEQTMVAAVG